MLLWPGKKRVVSFFVFLAALSERYTQINIVSEIVTRLFDNQFVFKFYLFAPSPPALYVLPAEAQGHPRTHTPRARTRTHTVERHRLDSLLCVCFQPAHHQCSNV